MNTEHARNINLSFIVTTARTGSTLLSTMLNSHPNVVSTVEEPFAYSLYPKYSAVKKWTSEIIQEYCDDFYLFSEGRLAMEFGSRKDLVSLLEKHKEDLDMRFVTRLTFLCFFPQKNKENITHVVDKELVLHECIDEVAGFYPKGKFIILYRDPRDNAFTKWRLFEKRKQTAEQNYYKIALDWNYVYGRLRNAKKKYPEKFFEIKYEDLVDDPENELKKLCAFLGISYDPIMLEYDKIIKHELETPFYQNMDETAKNHFLSIQGGLFIKPDKEKIGYWKKFLSADEANLIWTINGKLAQEVGYTVHEGYKRTLAPLKSYIGLYGVARDRLKSILYYNAPFWLKRLVKKIKYGKNIYHPRNTFGPYFK
ncbi:MAG: sulfotransferase family protein, partial [Bacteroidia bacterium]